MGPNMHQKKKIAFDIFFDFQSKKYIQMDSKRSKSAHEGILRVGQKRALVGHFCQKAEPKKTDYKIVATSISENRSFGKSYFVI